MTRPLSKSTKISVKHLLSLKRSTKKLVLHCIHMAAVHYRNKSTYPTYSDNMKKQYTELANKLENITIYKVVTHSTHESRQSKT